MTDLISRVENLARDLDALRAVYSETGRLTMPGDTAWRTAAVSSYARSIDLVSGLLRNVVARGAAGRPFTHASVFGGTQVGKSTVVNLLCGCNSARVHYTAGFTRHAQGSLAPEVTPEAFHAAHPLTFRNFQRVDCGVLSMERPMEYCLQQLPRSPATGVDALWDGPDCDAVEAARFQQSMVETATLADAVVYVASREKYAVMAILQWLAHFQAAGIPIVGCLNMVPPNQQADLQADMRDAMLQVMKKETPDSEAEAPPVVCLEYVPDGDVSLFYSDEYAPAVELRKLVAKAATQDAKKRRRDALRYVRTRLPEILEPVSREEESRQKWFQEIESALPEFAETYRRQYLNDPKRYTAFNQVGIEILALLDPPIPGLRKALTTVRTVVGMPARLLITGGKRLVRWARTGQSMMDNEVRQPSDMVALVQGHEQLLNRLTREATRHRRDAANSQVQFWEHLQGLLEDQMPVFQDTFKRELDAYRLRMQEHISEAARAIYEELAREPVRLNMLRGGRLSADAGAIILAVKSGGAGDLVHDAIMAPALLSLLEVISEHLAGGFVEQRRKKLKEDLTEDARRFADTVYGVPLRELADQAFLQAGFPRELTDRLREFSTRLDEIEVLMEKVGR